MKCFPVVYLLWNCVYEGVAQAGTSETMCDNYQPLNSFLPPVVKAHSKAQGILNLVSGLK